MYSSENRKRAYSVGWTCSLGLLYQHTTDWWLIDNRDLRLSVIEPGKSKVKLPASPVSDETLPSGPCMAVFPASPLWQRDKRIPRGLFSKGTNLIHESFLITSQRPHLQVIALWELNFNIWIWGWGTQSMAKHMYLPDLNSFDLHKQQFQVVQPHRYTGDWSEYVRGPCQPLFLTHSHLWPLI